MGRSASLREKNDRNLIFAYPRGVEGVPPGPKEIKR
jgi:hypothetical protein